MTREEAGNSIFKELPNIFEPGNPMVEDLYVVTPRGVNLIWSWMVDERLARREAEVSAKGRGDKCVEWECDYATLETKLEKAEARVKELEEFVRIAPLSNEVAHIRQEVLEQAELMVRDWRKRGIEADLIWGAESLIRSLRKEKP